MIKFYKIDDEYGCFSNFAHYPIKIKGKTWPTTEHYFQAQKFAGTELEHKIQKQKTPSNAAKMGRSRKFPLRKDWGKVKDSIMYEAVLKKFQQHEDIRKILLNTEDKKIIEHTTNDSYWGDGGDGSGKNKLGIILMQVRKHLKKQGSSDE